MRNIYKVTAIFGTLGLSGVLAINFLDGGKTAPEIASQDTNQHQSEQITAYSSDKSELFASSVSKLSFEELEVGFESEVEYEDFLESDDVIIEEINGLSDMTESEALEYESFLASQTQDAQAFIEEELWPEDNSLDDSEPFLGHEAGLKYKEFFSQFDSDESLTEEQIQEFFSRVLATLETSDEAKDAIAQAYRNTGSDEDVERAIIAEMLMKTDTGRQVLLGEAKSVLESGQTDRFSEMFQAYQNIDDKINTEVLDQALYSASTSTDFYITTSALNYIGEIENDKDISPVYIAQTISTLKNISLYNENEDVLSLATQKLYRILGPEESTSVAQYNIDNNVSSPLVIETLYSVSSGDVNLTDDLKNSLASALNREDVTPEEIELAKELLPTILES